jgi:hypothetical protein
MPGYLRGFPATNGGFLMKYVMAWTTRYNGSGQDNEAVAKRGVAMFSNWTPPAGITFDQFVGRLDGAGGFAVVESDSAADLLEGVSKFAPFNEFQLYPVVDIEEWIRAASAGIEFRESIS